MYEDMKPRGVTSAYRLGVAEALRPWLGRKPLGPRRLALTCLGAGVVTLAAITPVLYLASPAARVWLGDFRGDFYTAGRDILHGLNPYASSYSLIVHLAAAIRAGHPVDAAFITPTKPAPLLLAAVPFALLPAGLASALFVALLVLAIVLALRVLDVHDWRCYVVALWSWPTVQSLHLGNTSPLLVLGIAVLWRTRGRLLAPAVALAGIVLIKLFPWPMAVWLLITRRVKALALGALIAAVAAVAAWAVIGFAGFGSYPRMLQELDRVLAGSGVSLATFLGRHGFPASGQLALAAGLLLLAYSWLLARHGEERRSFAIAVLAVLAAAPHAWDHYYLLLFVPIALVSPRLSWLWLVPALTWPSPWQLSLCVLAQALVFAAVLRDGRLGPAVRSRVHTAVTHPSVIPVDSRR